MRQIVGGRIISRYIAKEVITTFLITLFAFTAMLLVINMLRFASLVVSKGVSLTQISTVFLALTPTFLEIALPMSALLGVMIAFARLSGDSELVIVKASGISLFQLLKPIAVFCIGTLVMAAFISLSARPWGYNTLAEILFEIASRQSTAALEEGVFSQVGPLTIYSSKIDHMTGRLERVLIDDRREKNTRKIIVSDSGIILSDPEQKIVVFKLENGVIHEEVEGKFSITQFQTNRLAMDPQDFAESGERKGKSFQAMSLEELSISKSFYSSLLDRIRSGEAIDPKSVEAPFGQLLAPDQFTKKELKKRINRAKIEHGRRFSMPFAALILGFVGMALGVQPPRTQRTWGLGLSALLGMFVFLVYYSVLSVGIALCESGSVPPVIALWLPNLIIFAIALLLLWKIGSERWESVLDGLVGVRGKLKLSALFARRGGQ